MKIFMKSSCSIASIVTSVWQLTVAVRRWPLISATSYMMDKRIADSLVIQVNLTPNELPFFSAATSREPTV